MMIRMISSRLDTENLAGAKKYEAEESGMENLLNSLLEEQEII